LVSTAHTFNNSPLGSCGVLQVSPVERIEMRAGLVPFLDPATVAACDMRKYITWRL